MSDTILGGDFTVYYLDENRQKRIEWTGGATGTRTANQLYSALQDLFDENIQMDDGIPMSAETPVEYTLGKIDAGDLDPWFIHYEAMEHLTGGAIKSSGWTRSLPGDGTGDVGIVYVPVTSATNNITTAEYGLDITHADGDAGTLLEILSDGGATDYLVIRPDTNALADDFNSTSGNLTCNALTAAQTAAATTGEQIWANFYTVTPIDADTHVYLYQGLVSDATRARIAASGNNAQDWWGEGSYDRTIFIRDFKTTASPIIDLGYVTAFVRKGTTLYDSFELQASNTSGGRNPIPLSASSDLNQTTGTANLAWDNGSTDTLVDLERLYNVGTTTAGNLLAGVADDGGTFTDDTTDLNDVGGAGDVAVFPATEAENDAFYFGMAGRWSYLMVDVQTQGVAAAASTAWEYYDGTTWSTLTVTDDSDSGNGAFTQGTGRFVISWSIPTDWTATTVSNQPSGIGKPYYIRVRIIAGFNYTTVPVLETAWAAGRAQLKAVVRDSSITTAGGATGDSDYYLIGEPQTNFSDNDVVIAGTSRKTFDIAGAPTAQGPALATWFTNNTPPTIAHANTTVDIDDDGTAEGYGITIDCNQNPLTEVYEWLKYITRNGETSTGSTDGIEGEQYEGATVYLTYTGAVTGSIAEGSDVTQETSGATGIVISHDTTLKQILLRNTRGTFATHATTHTLTDNDTTGTVEIDGVATTFTPVKASPFGTFAGGRFFGARGVVLIDYIIATDENSFQLTDSSGTVRQRPQAYSITVTNLVGGAETLTTSDRVAAFRLTAAGGVIDKTEYSSDGTGAIGDPTLVVDTAITTDTPGKTTGGVLRIRDASNDNKEYRLRYDSWATSTFTLSNFAAFVTTATTNSTQITYATGGFNGAVLRGDLVYNSTQTAVSYVASVDSDTQLTIAPAITGQTDGDTVEINALPIAMNTLDDVFVSLIDEYATGTTATVSIITGGATIDYRVVVRNVAATTKIKPFTADDAISTANRSTATIRTTDTIFT